MSESSQNSSPSVQSTGCSVLRNIRCFQNAFRTIITVVSLLVVVPALAQSLPLDGYYRPGEYMPVKLGATQQTRIVAPQCVPTIVAASSQPQIVPFLTLSDAAVELKVGTQSFLIRALKPNQRLIGLVDVEPAGIARVFPNHEIVTVKLERGDLQNAVGMSFDSLDVVVCSADTFMAIDAKTIDMLLDCGVTLAVRSSSPPDRRRTWETLEDFQLLRAMHPLPMNATPRQDVYQPIQSWRPQRSAGARLLMVLIGSALAVTVLAFSLLPRRFAAVSIVSFCLVASLGIWMATRQRRARTWVVTGEIQHQSQKDVFHYFASADTQHFEESLRVAGYPIPYSLSHAADLNLQLHVDGERVSVSFDLNSTRRLCLLTRGDWRRDDSEPIDVSALSKLSAP